MGEDKLTKYVIPWLTGFIWRESPGGVARCRGCGSKLLTGQDAYRYIYGWFRQTPQRGYLCQECGQTALQAIIDKASTALLDPIEATLKERIVQLAVDDYAYEDLEIGPNVCLCESDRGYWVSAWVWVPKSELGKEEEDV